MLYETIVYREHIPKGWSADRKYRIQTVDAGQYLLRISPKELYERRKQEFRRVQMIAKLGIDLCLPIEFGLCDEGVYSIHTWIDGQDAESVIPVMPKQDQYAYGIAAGEILAKLHTVKPEEEDHDWEQYFTAKVQRKITAYGACEFHYPGGESMIRYLKENMDLLKNRPVTYQHGDYHIGNMMIGRDGKLYIIDFEKDSFGDPWEEFNRIVWSAQAAPKFAKGLLDGYFGGSVPEDFWKLMAFYICANSIGALPWAIPYGELEVNTMLRQAAEILSWYDNMNQIVPSWYRKE